MVRQNQVEAHLLASIAILRLDYPLKRMAAVFFAE